VTTGHTDRRTKPLLKLAAQARLKVGLDVVGARRGAEHGLAQIDSCSLVKKDSFADAPCFVRGTDVAVAITRALQASVAASLECPRRHYVGWSSYRRQFGNVRGGALM